MASGDFTAEYSLHWTMGVGPGNNPIYDESFSKQPTQSIIDDLIARHTGKAEIDISRKGADVGIFRRVPEAAQVGAASIVASPTAPIEHVIPNTGQGVIMGCPRGGARDINDIMADLQKKIGPPKKKSTYVARKSTSRR